MSTPADQNLLTLAANHAEAGRFDDAVVVYRQLLEKYPGNAELLHEIGAIILRTGRAPEARPWLEQAVAINPGQPIFLNNLGSALQSLGEHVEAVRCYERAVLLDPSRFIIRYNIGYAQLSLGQWDAAAAQFRYVIEHIPDHADAYVSLGHVLMRKGDVDNAIETYRAGLLRCPSYHSLWNNLGNALKVKADWEGAVVAYREALRYNPNSALAANNLGDSLLDLGRPEEGIEYFRKSSASNPNLSEAHSNLIFAMHLDPEATSSEIDEECRRWWRRHGAPLQVEFAPTVFDRDPDRRLRVGYVSADLRKHPVGHHLLPVMRAHDTERFEIFVYSNVQLPDALTAQFRDHAARWHESEGWSDEQLSAQIRRDQIDILIDLSQHSAGNRLRVFARQPAPVQVSFAGYPGGTGVETIGWRITDRFLNPPEDPPQMRETLIRLPDSFWCFDPLEETPPVNALPALENGFVTFGCLSKLSKMNARVLGWWVDVLRQVPHSCLLLLCPSGGERTRIENLFQGHGIAGERLRFTDRLPRADYFALHHQIDLILDPFPYNGHMTTCDALWMGVPVVSLSGDIPVSRGGLSLLSNVGLPELAVTTPADYVGLAVKLAGDLPRLATLRNGLRQRMKASPLTDVARFTRGLEACYRTIWQQWSIQDATVSTPEPVT
jgi:predicted O-linked N-acetylglucosamine transferase (SPINDLY family)